LEASAGDSNKRLRTCLLRGRWLSGVFLGLPWQRGRRARSGGCDCFFFLADRGGVGVEELLGICIFLV
jgi:hypothetical protein